MISQRHERISEVFLAVCELPAEEQAKALGEHCADEPWLRSEVEALLESDAEEDSAFLQSPALGEGFSVQRNPGQVEPEPSLCGTRIGHYHLRRVIASGGMGTVYQAQQDEPRRTLAVKVMKRGITSQSALKRFEYESQILAHLHHRGIAHVYEAGRYEEGGGVPYFAMELIADAKTITDYAKGHKLTTRQRLDLFSKVCDAVHHGHQKGVIHRDLKPSNILVDAEGEPKIIDFGVARATDSDLAITTLQTDEGQLIGTLQYMSPEQCEGHAHALDTRSDVYSLGVVLYELLCDRIPCDVSGMTVPQAIRVIREETPARPSTINRTLRGDIETIILKAIEKERRDRYDSAAALADDIRRYLDDEPIVARPASAIYQLGKFARRNKALVGGAGVAAAAILVGLTAVWWKNAQLNEALGELSSTNVALTAEKHALLESEASANLQRAAAVAARESEREARLKAEENAARARVEALKANTVVELLDNMLSSADPHEVKGPNYTLRQLLDDFDVGLGNRLEDQPEVECTVRQTMGSAYLGLGQMDTAEPHLSRALDLARGELQEDPNVLTGCLRRWAQLQHDRGRYAEAEGTLREELELLSWPGEESEEISDGMNLLGDVLRHLARYGESERLHRDALAMRRKLLGEEHPSVAAVLGALASLRRDQGRYAEAERLHREALEMRRKLLVEENTSVATNLNNLAIVLASQGKHAEAERMFREALELDRKLLGEHPSVAMTLNSLAHALEAQKKYAEAEGLHREALEMRRKLLGDEDLEVASSLNDLALVLRDQKKYAEAERLDREALEMRRKLLGDEDLEVARSLNDLALVLSRQGRYEEAERLHRETLEMSRKLLGDEDLDVATSLHNLAGVLRGQGKYAEAERLAREVLEMRRTLLDEEHPQVATSRHTLAVFLADQGKYAEAERLYREALEMRRKLFGDEDSSVVSSLNNLGAVLWEQGKLGATGKYEEAERLHREALETRRKRRDEDPTVAESLNNLAVVLSRQGRYEEAERLHREALEMVRKLLGDEDPLVTTHLNMLVGLLKHNKDHVGAGRVLLDIGRFHEALPLLRLHLSRCEESPSEDSVELAEAKSLVGACLLGQAVHRARNDPNAEDESERELAQAADLLLEGYEGLPDTLEEVRDQRIQAAAWLVQLFEAMDSPDDAEHWRSILEELDGESAR